MSEIKYEIGLNEQERPYIKLPEDYEQKPEDRFFAMEITRYILQDLLKRKINDLDSDTIQQMDEAERLLGQLGDGVATLLYERMRVAAETTLIYGKKPSITVNSIEERDALPDKDILYDNMLFDRKEGLEVHVMTRLNGGGWHCDYYKLVDGITNENWVKNEFQTN